ncbi:MAG: aminotransferase class I/II-fold pyridoxal phosphate-dependent enzyme, partial [Oscillospiraceae bacterium]|nr:aminotransferase class I/II-fold pyridoxal phosphate-dependent enzyme [Oscillospiraceae bacterium]
RTYALENPSYDKISRVYIANGVNYEMLKMGKDGIKSDELRKSQATVLHITPFNSFPSGVTATASKRREYILWAKERGGYIIEDNYESELTVSKKNEDTVFSLSHQGPVIYLNTFSKTIAPSIRVGYMVLPEEMLGEFESKLGFYSCTVPVFEQYVLAELIQSGSFERHINRVRRIKRKQAGI